MKYSHLFQLVGKKTGYRLYRSGDLFIRLDFFNEGMRFALYKDEKDLFPTFSVCPGTSLMPRHGRARLSNENLHPVDVGDGDFDFEYKGIKIHADPLNFRVSYYKEGKLLFSDRDVLAYNFEGELGKGSYHYVSREDKESIYGLGDKTGPVNKAGRFYRFSTKDAMGYDADSSDPLYKQIPFYICKNSVGNYGIYYDTYSDGEIDLGREIDNYFEHFKYVHFEEDSLVYYVFFGSLSGILSSYSYLIGRSMVPPLWTYQYCGSTMAYTDSDHPEAELRNFVSLCKEYGIHCGGFYLSSGYTQIGTKRMVFHWNKDKFPDPKAFALEMKKEGLHFLPNIKPAFLTDHPLYPFLKEKGYFLKDKEGNPALFPFWGGMGSFLDFTNDGAYSFWTECCKKNLVDLGYASLWNDNNEYEIHDEDVYADGFGKPVQAKLIRTLFPLLMVQSSFEAEDSSKKHMEVTRAGTPGFQRLAQTWTGDNRTSFKDFRGNHRIAMSLSLSGVPFFGQDIGGFAGEKPTKELFLRWIQYGIFTPRFCLHSWNPDGTSTMPWLYPDLKESVMKLFALRERLLPYLYSEGVKAAYSYEPLIYPVFLRNPSYDEESDCFCCGSSLLACPIFDEGKTEMEVDLPEDSSLWYRNKKPVSGHQKEQVLPTDLPLFYVRGGSVLPIYGPFGKVRFEIYSLKEGKSEGIYYPPSEELQEKGIPYSVEWKEDSVLVKGLQEIETEIVDPYQRKAVFID